MSVVAVTGSSGFVGRAVLDRLAGGPHDAIALVRSDISAATCRQRPMPDLASLAKGETDIDLSGIEILVHCAALAQSVKNPTNVQRQHLSAVNAEATAVLARRAVASGVKRFVLVSSAKVNGETTFQGASFGADDVPRPEDDYARSKLQAEQNLLVTAKDTAMQTVIIRPPLVYGAGVKGNFRQLVKLSSRGLPLPLGGVQNRRSMIAVDNLADLIAVTLDHPNAAGRTLMASDGEDLSTPELIARLAKLQGAAVRMVNMPPALLLAALTLLGQKTIAQRLLGSLQVDGASTRRLLGWTPPVNVDEALRKTVGGPC